jgi:hypothetical protein
MRRAALILVTCVGVVLLGCGASTAPQRLSGFGEREAPMMMRAPYDGRYVLYWTVQSAPGKKVRTAIESMHLKRGDPLGFRQRQAGPFAVGGELEIPLADSGNYEWIMQADGGQLDWVKTAVLVAAIVVVIAGVLAIYAVVEFNKLLE